jgi:ABC-2 type transport system permease protein
MKKIALKDLKIFFADKRAVFLAFLLPIALITLFSLVYTGIGTKGNSNKVKLVVADEDSTDASTKIIAQLAASKLYNVQQTSVSNAEKLVKKGNASSVLVLHKGMKDSIQAGKNAPFELKFDEAKKIEIQILEGSLVRDLMNIVGTRSLEKSTIANIDKEYRMLDSGMRTKIHEQISKNFSNAEKQTQQSLIKITPLVAEAETSPGLVQAVAGTAIMMLLFSLTAMGASLLDEKQEGTLKRLLFSPINPDSILFGKMLFTNIVSIIQLTVMFLYTWLVFGLNIHQNLPALLLTILATSFACSSFGVFLASAAKTRQQIQGMSTLIILVMSCIGGSMIPIYFMPIWMQKASVFSVNYWGIQSFYDVFWRKLPIGDSSFLYHVGVLFGIGLILNLIALRLYRKNILKLI